MLAWPLNCCHCTCPLLSARGVAQEILIRTYTIGCRLIKYTHRRAFVWFNSPTCTTQPVGLSVSPCLFSTSSLFRITRTAFYSSTTKTFGLAKPVGSRTTALSVEAHDSKSVCEVTLISKKLEHYLTFPAVRTQHQLPRHSFTQ